MKRVLLVLAAVVLFGSTINAQVNVNEAKAKFIYNFTKFFDWPLEERTGDFVIGVLASQDIYSELETYTKGKKVGSQNIVVKKFKRVDDVTNCHMLFISEFEANSIEGIHKKTGHYTLLMSDFGGAIQMGTAINFDLQGDRLKYEFSSTNSLKYGLKFSSKIQEMAVRNYN